MARKRIAVKKRARPKPQTKRAREREPEPKQKPSRQQIDLITPHGEGVPDQLVDELTRTLVWVIVASVLVFLGSIGALILSILAWVAMAAIGGDKEVAEAMTADQMVSGLVAVIWLVATVILATVGIRMILFAKRIHRLERTRQESDLEIVLAHLKGFWGLLGGGMLTMVIIVGAVALIQFAR